MLNPLLFNIWDDAIMAIQHLSHKQHFTLEILNILYIFVMILLAKKQHCESSYDSVRVFLD